MANYEVFVGNIGSVYSGPSFNQALNTFRVYVKQSKSGFGRAGNEDIVILGDDEIMESFSFRDWRVSEASKKVTHLKLELELAQAALVALTTSEE